MLPNVAVRGGELLAAVLIAGSLCVTVAAAGAWWLKRRVRRRLERLWRAVPNRAAGAAAGAARAGRRWLWSRPVPDRRWVRASGSRRTLWRAVSAADHAVAQARKAGAPTGELGGLCVRLRQAAEDTDRLLALGGRGTVSGQQPEPVSSRLADLVLAAGLIRDAAASAVASISQPAAKSLADDVRREAEALSAGIASASRAHRGRRARGAAVSRAPAVPGAALSWRAVHAGPGRG